MQGSANAGRGQGGKTRAREEESVNNCRCGSPKAKLAIIRGAGLVAYQVGEFGAAIVASSSLLKNRRLGRKGGEGEEWCFESSRQMSLISAYYASCIPQTEDAGDSRN
jgi:hypothetical protein